MAYVTHGLTPANNAPLAGGSSAIIRCFVTVLYGQPTEEMVPFRGVARRHPPPRRRSHSGASRHTASPDGSGSAAPSNVNVNV